MDETGSDILMITFNRPAYTRRSLERLLESCRAQDRVWVWHNGGDKDTLDIVQSLRDHPRFHRFFHNPTNQDLREPTNWMWSQAEGELLGKVDDDSLVPFDWIETLTKAHTDVPNLGAVGCWHYPVEDIDPGLYRRKLLALSNGHGLLQNCWIGGTGYLMKRACIEEVGLLGPNDGWTTQAKRIASHGWLNGWYFPFLYVDHMDDPRSKNTLIRTDEDVVRLMPRMARQRGISTIVQWTEWLKQDARFLQVADPDPRLYVGTFRHLRRKIKQLKWRFEKSQRYCFARDQVNALDVATNTGQD